jgi:hypothetical protein
MDTFLDFAEAEKAKAVGQMVCGTLLKDGSPAYFLLAADTADADVREVAFSVREGRQMSDYERLLLQQAELLRSSGVPA